MFTWIIIFRIGMNFTSINLFTLFWKNNDSNNNNNNDNVNNNNNNNIKNNLNNQQSTSTAYYQRRSLVQGWWFASVQGSAVFDGIVCDGGARRPTLLSSTTGMQRSWLLVLINLLCYFFSLLLFIFEPRINPGLWILLESIFIPKVGINGLLIMIPSFILWSKHCQLFHFWIPIPQSGMWTHHKCFRKINIHNKCELTWPISHEGECARLYYITAVIYLDQRPRFSIE